MMTTSGGLVFSKITERSRSNLLEIKGLRQIATQPELDRRIFLGTTSLIDLAQQEGRAMAVGRRLSILGAIGVPSRHELRARVRPERFVGHDPRHDQG